MAWSSTRCLSSWSPACHRVSPPNSKPRSALGWEDCSEHYIPNQRTLSRSSPRRNSWRSPVRAQIPKLRRLSPGSPGIEIMIYRSVRTQAGSLAQKLYSIVSTPPLQCVFTARPYLSPGNTLPFAAHPFRSAHPLPLARRPVHRRILLVGSSDPTICVHGVYIGRSRRWR